MGVLDILLFPLYVYIFNLVFSARRKRISDPILQKYHKHAFWLKIASTIAFTIFYFYISPGDSTTLYYPEGVNIFHLVFKNAANIKWIFLPGKDFDPNLIITDNAPSYFLSESNFFIIQLVAFFSFITFGRYVIINLMFAFIAFSGIWRLYKFFYEQYPYLHKQLAIAIIYLPTLIFWTSGILKDPVCVGMLGWLTYSLYQIFIKGSGIIKNLFIAFVSGAVLLIVKDYILFSYLPFFVLFIILRKIYRIKSFLLKIFISLFLILISVYSVTFISDNLQDLLGSQVIDNLAENVKTQQSNYINMSDLAGSSFSLGVEFDGTPKGLLKIAPAAITASLYRPFLWESKKASTLLSSLESLAMMLLTLYVLFKVGPFNFILAFFKDPMILFCFCFSLVFALFVGAITLNFGTLVRYKIPCLPFYIIGLFLILDIYNQKKKNKLIKRATPLLANY